MRETGTSRWALLGRTHRVCLSVCGCFGCVRVRVRVRRPRTCAADVCGGRVRRRDRRAANRCMHVRVGGLAGSRTASAYEPRRPPRSSRLAAICLSSRIEAAAACSTARCRRSHCASRAVASLMVVRSSSALALSACFASTSCLSFRTSLSAARVRSVACTSPSTSSRAESCVCCRSARAVAAPEASSRPEKRWRTSVRLAAPAACPISLCSSASSCRRCSVSSVCSLADTSDMCSCSSARRESLRAASSLTVTRSEATRSSTASVPRRWLLSTSSSRCVSDLISSSCAAILSRSSLHVFCIDSTEEVRPTSTRAWSALSTRSPKSRRVRSRPSSSDVLIVSIRLSSRGRLDPCFFSISAAFSSRTSMAFRCRFNFFMSGATTTATLRLSSASASSWFSSSLSRSEPIVQPQNAREELTVRPTEVWLADRRLPNGVTESRRPLLETRTLAGPAAHSLNGRRAAGVMGAGSVVYYRAHTQCQQQVG